MSNQFEHGHIRCGTIVVNDLSISRSLYCSEISHEVVEHGQISTALSEAWGAPAMAGTDYCLLQANGVADSHKMAKSYLRLIQSPTQQEPNAHATTYGWCAFEINVKDVFKLYDQIKSSNFEVVGPPKKMDGISNVIPMQVVGPDQEVLYLNQVFSSDETTDLPISDYDVDRIFIVVLGSHDLERSLESYTSDLNLTQGPTFELRYSLINRAFNLDPETKHTLSLLQHGRLPVMEIDGYPSPAKTRPIPDGGLSLGNAIVSLVVDDLDSLNIEHSLVGELNQDAGLNASLLYRGARTRVIKGNDGELLELIEHPES